jgi:hypothetical protein
VQNGNGGRSPTAVANSGLRLFVQMLNPTIYFRKIEEEKYIEKFIVMVYKL